MTQNQAPAEDMGPQSAVVDFQKTLGVDLIGIQHQITKMAGFSKALDSMSGISSLMGTQHQITKMAGLSKALDSMSETSGITNALTSWSPIFRDGGFLASVAIDFQKTNAAAASTLAAVAAQRVAASYRGAGAGSFDGQFAAVAKLLDVEDVPVSLREQLSDAAEDPQIIQAAAANVGLSRVPAEPRDRWILALLVGYAAMVLYGFVQVGMTADPFTPELVMGSIGTGTTGFAAVRWAPDVLEKLKKSG